MIFVKIISFFISFYLLGTFIKTNWLLYLLNIIDYFNMSRVLVGSRGYVWRCMKQGYCKICTHFKLIVTRVKSNIGKYLLTNYKNKIMFYLRLHLRVNKYILFCGNTRWFSGLLRSQVTQDAGYPRCSLLAFIVVLFHHPVPMLPFGQKSGYPK